MAEATAVYRDLLLRAEAGDELAFLTALQTRLAEDARHWEQHMNRYHPPYRRAQINLTGPWWDCLPSSAPYGDGLLDEVTRRLVALAPVVELDKEHQDGSRLDAGTGADAARGSQRGLARADATAGTDRGEHGGDVHTVSRRSGVG